MNRAFLDYYRCPDDFADLRLAVGQKQNVGFFRFGREAVCYGTTHLTVSQMPSDPLPDHSDRALINDSHVQLPFDPTEVVDNLRRERYVAASKPPVWKVLVRNTYYLIRPALPVSFRRHLQRAWLGGRNGNRFPAWPIERSVDRIFEELMLLCLRAKGLREIPFIWFWPNGKASAAMMTHDVETKAGLDFVHELMNINDSFGIKSSFQIIPEERYRADDNTLAAIRSRGFEINVHDLKHDGHLFDDREQFAKAALQINEYAKLYGSKGFRSGVLYRNQEWLGDLSVSYDMSVPNNGHFDPQPGGCCTLMPYFLGSLVELPVTTTQDYSLFNILGTYSTDLWKSQVQQIIERHGLASFIVHPDYLDSVEAKNAYKDLLQYLDGLRSTEDLWIALPAEIDTWWRQRSQMRLVCDGSRWTIVGAGSERARIAYAELDGKKLNYRVS